MKRSALFVLSSLMTCCTCGESAVVDAPAASTSATVAIAASEAPSTSSFVTHTGRLTSPELAMNNLDAQLSGQVKLMGNRPKDVGVRATVVSLYLARFKITGKSDDLARALDLAESVTTIDDKSFGALVLRARGRAAAHRFDEALADLAEADKVLGPGDRGKTDGPRASIFVALGRYEEALPIVANAARITPDAESLADHAYLLGLMGSPQEAEALFLQAEQKHRGTSPFGLVQIYFDRAMMWEKQGRLAEATALFKAANQRLPLHAHAAVHLAALLPPGEGIKVLEPVAAITDDPDVFAELGVLQNLVAPKSGDAMLEKAKAAYDELFAKLPSGYADHAGWFWVTTGGDPAKGLAAAKKNIAVRKTSDAYELLIAAAEAAKDTAILCGALKEGGALKYASAPLKERVRQLDGKVACKP